MIRCKLSELMGEHQILKISTLAQQTGINRNTLTNMYYDRVHRIEVEVMDKLCQYFSCGINDLFEYQNNDLYKSIFKEIRFFVTTMLHDIPFSQFRQSEVHRQFVVSEIIKDIENRLLPSQGKALLIASDQVEAIYFFEKIKSSGLLGVDKIVLNIVTSSITSDQDSSSQNIMLASDAGFKLIIVVSKFGQENGIANIDTVYIHRSLTFNQVLLLASNMARNSKSEGLEKTIIDYTGLFEKFTPSLSL